MIGRTLAHYRITAKLGEGGMGEVYRATDSKLEREVAVKILPASFVADPERLARFEREAKVLASLNHANIAAIYGVEHEEDVRALVLELVDGPTLAERLAAGRIERDEALRLGCQIAEALEEAHGRGIVHRDLKPANVKVTPGGRVKVLDFGLAKALDPMSGSDSAPSQLAHSPTLTIGATMQGVILGTAAYMSPEQARGAQADARADVWAFGVVLFEMLAGRSLFSGPTVSDTLASVLKVEPDLAQLPSDTPRKLRRLLERCLRKDPHERLHAIADARIVLEEVLRGELDEPAEVAAAAPPRSRGQLVAAAGVALIAGAALALGIAALLEPPPAPPRVLRFEIAPPAGLNGLGAPKVSPDGRHIAFVARNDKGTAQVWIRSLAASEPRPLPGTDGVTTNGRPFWSPDSRHVAFFTADKLLKAPIDGGPPIKISDANGADGSWSENGVIVFDGATNAPLLTVASSGGVPRPLIEGEAGQGGFNVAWPQFLPGGEKLLYVVFQGDEERNGIWIANADGSGGRRVVAGLSRVEFVPPHWLLFVRDTTLVAQRFDLRAGELAGEPMPIVDGLGVSTVGLAEFSAAGRDDVLAYRALGGSADELAFFDVRGGREAEAAASGAVNHPTFSTDGRWLAYDVESERGDRDVWIRDLRRGVSSRVTSGAESEFGAVFSPDGERLYFARVGGGGIYQIVSRPLGPGEETVLVERNVVMGPTGISPDGRWLVVAEFPSGKGELVVLDLEAGGEPKRLTSTAEFSESRASFSPDGRWLLYQSDESGSLETYVQPFPGPGRRLQISTAGGVHPFWAPDGRHLYYRDADRQLVRVAVETGARFDAQLPEPLFPLVLSTGPSLRRIAVSPDGARFVATVPGDDGGQAATSVVVGWRSLVERR